MKQFTDETEGYDTCPCYIAFRTFFENCLTKRDYEKTLSLLDDDCYIIGTGEKEFSINKPEFAKLLSAELKALPASVKYEVISFNAKEITTDIWNFLVRMKIVISDNPDETLFFPVRFTGCFKFDGQSFSIISMHMSEASSITENTEFLPFRYISSSVNIDKAQTEQLIFEIISKTMPGGIVSGYIAAGFPLYFVNEEYLELLGYSSYAEYYNAANGLGITHIHPDDRNMVNEAITGSSEACSSSANHNGRYSTNTQYAIEYRIRHKDGHYIHVYDIGRKMTSPDGKDVIICVLYDMTENFKLKEVLTQEANYDSLTGIYNRRGGIKRIESTLNEAGPYTFIFFDIDNLKLLNDIYSHAAGDHSLKYFAELLMKYFDSSTILSRFGGDEFVALVKNCPATNELELILSALIEEYCRFTNLNYPLSNSSVSAGCIAGTKAASLEELYRASDELMYDIKKHGKRGYKIVTE